MTTSDERAMIDGAEHDYQNGNMKIVARQNCHVGEMSDIRDLTGYNTITFGEGPARVIVSGDTGEVTVRAAPGSRIVLTPMNSEAVIVQSRAL
jgi:hypothetical protein